MEKISILDEIIGDLKIYGGIVNGELVLKNFDGSRIRDSLIRECKMSKKDAETITEDTISMLVGLEVPFLTAPLVREFVCISLYKHGFEIERYMYTRMGTQFADYDERYKSGKETIKWSGEIVHSDYEGIKLIIDYLKKHKKKWNTISIKPKVFSWNNSHQAPLTKISEIVLKTGISKIYQFDEDYEWNIIVVGIDDIEDALDFLLTMDFMECFLNAERNVLLKYFKIWEDYEK